MKLKYLPLILALSSMPVYFACSGSAQTESHEEHEHEHGEEHEHEHEHEHGHDEHGEQHADGEIVFSPEKAERFNVKTTKVALSDFNEIIKVSGQICAAQGDEHTIIARSSGAIKLNSNAVVSSSISAGASIGYISAKNIVGGDANDNARISYLSAKKELDRITPLYKDKIVTEKEYIVAKENYEKAKIAYNSHNSSSGSSATSAISGTITRLCVADGEYVEIGAPIAVVSKNAKLNLRADLPERYAANLPMIKSALFKPSYSESTIDLKELNGRRISSNTAVASTPGYIPVMFEFNNNGKVVPGSFAEVYLVGSSKPNSLVLPIEAVTEEQGEYFVYARLDEDCYMKKSVTLGMNNGKDVEILSGISAGDEIVTSGAVIIKMAANTGAVPGHNHNH